MEIPARSGAQEEGRDRFSIVSDHCPRGETVEDTEKVMEE